MEVTSPPNDIKMTPISFGFAHLEWAVPTAGHQSLLRYHIWKREDKSEKWEKAGIAKPPKTFFPVRNMDVAKPYLWFALTAENMIGISKMSESVIYHAEPDICIRLNRELRHYRNKDKMSNSKWESPCTTATKAKHCTQGSSFARTKGQVANTMELLSDDSDSDNTCVQYASTIYDTRPLFEVLKACELPLPRIPPPEDFVPSQPLDIKLGHASHGVGKLRWSPPHYFIKTLRFYIIWRREYHCSEWEKVDTCPHDETFYIIAGEEGEKKYWFAVSAENCLGSGPRSDSVLYHPDPSMAEKLNRIFKTNTYAREKRRRSLEDTLMVQRQRASSIDLSPQLPGTVITKEKEERKDQTSATTQTDVSFKNFEPFGTLKYDCTDSLKRAKESVLSTIIDKDELSEKHLPSEPRNLRLIATLHGMTSLTWIPPLYHTRTLLQYHIFRRAEDEDYWDRESTCVPHQTIYTPLRFKIGVNYYYTVAAENNNGIGLMSKPVFFNYEYTSIQLLKNITGTERTLLGLPTEDDYLKVKKMIEKQKSLKKSLHKKRTKERIEREDKEFLEKEQQSEKDRVKFRQWEKWRAEKGIENPAQNEVQALLDKRSREIEEEKKKSSLDYIFGRFKEKIVFRDVSEIQKKKEKEERKLQKKVEKQKKIDRKKERKEEKEKIKAEKKRQKSLRDKEKKEEKERKLDEKAKRLAEEVERKRLENTPEAVWKKAKVAIRKQEEESALKAKIEREKMLEKRRKEELVKMERDKYNSYRNEIVTHRRAELKLKKLQRRERRVGLRVNGLFYQRQKARRKRKKKQRLKIKQKFSIIFNVKRKIEDFFLLRGCIYRRFKRFLVKKHFLEIMHKENCLNSK